MITRCDRVIADIRRQKLDRIQECYETFGHIWAIEVRDGLSAINDIVDSHGR